MANSMTAYNISSAVVANEIKMTQFFNSGCLGARSYYITHSASSTTNNALERTQSVISLLRYKIYCTVYQYLYTHLDSEQLLIDPIFIYCDNSTIWGW